MYGIPPISANHGSGVFGNARVSIRKYDNLSQQLVDQTAAAYRRPSFSTLRRIIRLREAVEAFKPIQLRTHTRLEKAGIAPSYATAASQAALDLGASAPTELRSTEEVNTAPTSFTAFGPNLVGSTATAPWSGPGSTAEATVSGVYDGSNGSGTLTFRVRREGVHGQDDLQIRVFAPDNSVIETIRIDKEEPLHKVYTLSNGLSITLGAGELVKDEEFTVDTTLLNTSYTPNQPIWKGSTAATTIGGVYLGQEGTGTLTFRVDRDGTHGQDNLRLKVYAPDGSFVQNVNIDKNDPLDNTYVLDNGLTLALGAGDLIKNETFEVFVDAMDPLATGPVEPQWIVSSAEATIGGTYDGSNGNGIISFQATKSGTHGQDDLTVKAFATDGSLLQNINIKASDPVGTVYSLSNGLTFTLGAGDLIKDETFTLEVQSATSFSTIPHLLESTAEVTIGGVYDGAQGTGDLSFLITQGGTHGTDDLTLAVYAPDETLLETIDVRQVDPLDQEYQMSNGLTFQLGSGTLVADETIRVSLNHQIGSRADPDKPLNGTRNDNPNLDAGQAITAGSFEINGVTISVLANDSINSVLDRITQSSADVTATFDADTETVLLRRNTSGAAETIALGNDTSGFLAGTKLVGAVPTNLENTDATPIAEIESLSSISSGSFQVNGVSIAINVNDDSIDDVVNRINASAADVTADFDVGTKRLSLTANKTENLVVDSAGTDFFEAFTITVGTYEWLAGQPGTARSAGLSQQGRRHVVKLMEDVARALNDLFEHTGASSYFDSPVEAVRSAVRIAIEDSFEPGRTELKTEFGINFNFNSATKQVMRFSTSDKKTLMSSLKSSAGAAEFRRFLFGKDTKHQGLVERLAVLTKQAQRDITLELGSVGIYVDTHA